MESIDYSQIERDINSTLPKNKLADLSALNVFAEYDQSESLTNNLEQFLKDNAYNGEGENPKLAYNHAVLLTRLIHEQCLVKGISEGLNDFKKDLEANCVAFEISGGKLFFYDADRSVIQEFDTEELFSLSGEEPKGTTRADLSKLRKQNIVAIAARSLGDIFPGMRKMRMPVLPKIPLPPFKLPVSAFRETGNPPLLLDLRASRGETICSGYVIEFIRYYFGNDWIYKHQLENTDAWEIRNKLLLKERASIKIDASLNSMLVEEEGKFTVAVTVQNDGERERLVGDDAKNSAVYQNGFYDFLDSAAKMPSHPPGLISLYFHGTRTNESIMRANSEGNDSHNSHIAVNLGLGKKKLNIGSSPGTNVFDIVRQNFPQSKSQFSWMMIQSGETEKSRVYLNGTPLIFRDDEFYFDDGTEEGVIATAGTQDVIEWEDVFVADRFHDKNRVIGLCEMMMTGKYEFVEAMSWNPEAIPKDLQIPTSLFATKEIIHLNFGETLEQALLERGITEKELPYHMYAYEREGLDPNKIRPHDPVPIYDKASIDAEIAKHGGLGGAESELKIGRAKLFNESHAGEYVFVITPRLTTERLAADIFNIQELKELGEINGEEKKLILQAVMAGNSNVLLKINFRGKITEAIRFNAGDIVYINKELTRAIVEKVKAMRIENDVQIPEELPEGEGFRPVKFSAEERGLIDTASKNPHVRRSLALILAMEQKQVQDGFRKWAKGKMEKVDLTNSAGLFQIRPTKEDAKLWAQNNPHVKSQDAFDEYFDVLQEDKKENTALAARRLEESMHRIGEIYDIHSEDFDAKKPGCTAFILNVYHSSEGNVLLNTFSVWTAQMEEAMGMRTPTYMPPKKIKGSIERAWDGAARDVSRLKRRVGRHIFGPSTEAETKLIAQLKVVAEKAKERGIMDATKEETEQALALILRDKIGFLKSPFFKKIEAAYSGLTGSRFSLNIPSEIMQRKDISTLHLNYGLIASQKPMLDSIKHFTQSKRAAGEKTV